MNIFVAKMSSSTTGEDLRTLFEAYGTVSSAKVIMDRETGNSKCFGFVEMDDESEGNNAINALNGTEVHGRVIVVKAALPREEMGERRSFRPRFNNSGYERRGYDRRGGYDRDNGHRRHGGYDRRPYDDRRNSQGYSRGYDHHSGYDRHSYDQEGENYAARSYNNTYSDEENSFGNF